MNSRAVTSGTDTQISDTSETVTRLHGWRLIAARAVVYTIIAFAAGLCLLSLPNLVSRLATPCAEPLNGCILSSQQALRLAQLGVTPGAVALGAATLSWLALLLSSSIGVVLLWRRSDDWMALLVALTLVLMPIGFTPLLSGLEGAWQVLGQALSSVGIFMLALLAGLFPSGRFVPRWLWLAVLAGAWSVFGPSVGQNDALLGALALLLYVSAILSLIGGQIYRYRRHSTPVQRQQTKWAVSGLVLAVVLNQAFWQPAAWIPALQGQDSLYLLLFTPDSFLMVCALAICFGVAILRYRLYDIDVIIRRTLIYGSLTAILAGVYLALVLGAQSAVHALTGQRGDEPVIIVATTLVIAALFNPLRRRIQSTIDRRFYRAKYDAAKTLEGFAVTLRGEVDLAELGDRLIGVVDETMRPAHVSLWLRPAPREGARARDGLAADSVAGGGPYRSW